MKKCYFLIFLPLFAFLNFSCERPDITPSYLLLHIEDFQDCIDDSNLEGYTQDQLDVIKHQDFKDALVSLNGTELGSWKLEWPQQRPCTIPLMPNYSQTNNIRIIPCARIPNTTLTTVPYYFLVPVEHFLVIEKEGAYRLSGFKFQYRTEVEFEVLETFVQGSDFSSIDSIHGADLRTPQVEIDGALKYVGRIALNDSVFYFNIANTYTPLPGQGTRIFWEIYYQSDFGEMTAYLNYRNSPMGIFDRDMVVLPSTKGIWKKIYIDLSEEVSLAAGYALSISTRLGIRGNLNKGAQNAYFHFGYIKLITMPSY